MTKDYTVNGVPDALAMDAWWLTSDTAAPHDAPPQEGETGQAFRPRALGLILLVILADFLFWGYQPGFSLAIFALAVFVVANMHDTTLSGLSKPAVLMIMSVSPVIEHVQLLSLMILLVGGLTALAWSRLTRADSAAWVMAALLRLVASLPLSGLFAVYNYVRDMQLHHNTQGASGKTNAHAIWRNWAFPVGGAFVLVSLLVAANPVLEQWLAEVLDQDINIIDRLQRVMFWCGIGIMLWPLIDVQQPHAALAAPAPQFGRRLGVNCGSVLRALIIFNACLAVQTVLDLSILFGGAALPDGMTYANYAHRGAYPLLATAMLAGAFALGAWPYLKEDRLVKPLLVLWVAQNVLLTLSALLRLDLYIGEYGLTYMRIYAVIWMAVVAAGLLLVLWHVLKDRTSGAMLRRVAMLGAGTLYLCAFVNFAGLIAADAIDRAADPNNPRHVYWDYVCSLGPNTGPAIKRGLAEHPELPTAKLLQACAKNSFTALNWRETDLRTLRAQRNTAPLFN